MQPKTHKDILGRTDAISRNWTCTPEYAIEFANMMLLFEVRDIFMTQRWLDISNYIENHLKQFYRSSEPQDAFSNNLVKGENNMLFGKTPQEREANIRAYQEAIRQQQEQAAIEVNNTIESVKAYMRLTNPLRYTLNDLFENVIIELKKERTLSPLKERLARQMIYGEKSNESH